MKIKTEEVHYEDNNIHDTINSSSVDPDYKIFLQNVSQSGTSYILKTKDLYVKYEQEEEERNPENYENTPHPVKKFIDESFQKFLNNVKLEGDLMILGFENGDSLVYEGEKGRGDLGNMEKGKCAVQSDEWGLVPYMQPSDTAEEGKARAPPTMELALSAGPPLSFDEKLEAVLGEPYDESEYEILWREATERKPVSRVRHLRGHDKLYFTCEQGLSYLDHYPELKIQLQSADRIDRLSLLRKFFFWLENLSHEGAYIPWQSRPLDHEPISDEECEPILPIDMAQDDNEIIPVQYPNNNNNEIMELV